MAEYLKTGRSADAVTGLENGLNREIRGLVDLLEVRERIGVAVRAGLRELAA
jgi:hypothetical protein